MPLSRLRRRKEVPVEEVGSPTTTATPKAVPSGPVTTVMVRNIPTRYTSLSLIEVLKEHGFEKTFDFLYLPMDFRTKKNVGYAFVNFINPDYVAKFTNSFQGMQLKANTSQKCLEIIPSRRQGFIDNIGVFGASELLTSTSQQAHFKPLVMVDGELCPLNDKLYDRLVSEKTFPNDACSISGAAPQVITS